MSLIHCQHNAVIFLTDKRPTTHHHHHHEFSTRHGWQVSTPGTVRTKAKAAAITTTTRAGRGGGWTNENRRGVVVWGRGIVVFLGEGRVRRHLSKKVSSRQSPVDGDGSGLVDSDECSSGDDPRSHDRGVSAAVFVPTTTSTTTSAMLLHSSSHLLDQVVVFHGNDAEPNDQHFPDIPI